MKKLIIFCTLFFTCLNSFGQQVEKTDWLQKSKNQKITAWVLLGTGAALDIVALATFPKNYDAFFPTDSEKKQANTSYWLLGIGSATMLASIPFTISGHVNKKKAASASVGINTQQSLQLKSSSLYTINYPALTLKIGF